ncbi:hypothetical protein CCHR01_16245 [Colletotrichum chrysophilum]|uniref:Uncharacterized protein n=1 Tax=Colletotrichum chrysophilum TaxID=1836956 RepID=A0AAD9EDM9_9PEZI|nr:hypothetical protein CCHR01_16245 [Colletotrichum chrysophilum]
MYESLGTRTRKSSLEPRVHVGAHGVLGYGAVNSRTASYRYIRRPKCGQVCLDRLGPIGNLLPTSRFRQGRSSSFRILRLCLQKLRLPPALSQLTGWENHDLRLVGCQDIHLRRTEVSWLPPPGLSRGGVLAVRRYESRDATAIRWRRLRAQVNLAKRRVRRTM